MQSYFKRYGCIDDFLKLSYGWKSNPTQGDCEAHQKNVLRRLLHIAAELKICSDSPIITI